MTISPLTDQAYVTSQKSGRGGVVIDHFIVHHAVSTNWRSVLDLMMGAKEVSANYIIGTGGEIISVVPEEYRAWTSSSAVWDGRSITVEVCNESLTGFDPNGPDAWPISNAAAASLAALIADVGQRYGFTPSRDGKASTVLGHRDLANWFDASYETVCPGNYLYNRLPIIAAGGEAAAKTNTIQEDPMFNLTFRTDGAGMCTSIFGTSGVGTQQLYELLFRVRNAPQLATPFRGDWTPGAYAGKPDTLNAAEYAIIDGFLALHRKAGLAGIQLDDAKLRAALSDALKGAVVNVDTQVDAAELAEAFEEVIPRVSAAIVKQAGEKLSA
jgi:hypothetical protein